MRSWGPTLRVESGLRPSCIGAVLQFGGFVFESSWCGSARIRPVFSGQDSGGIEYARWLSDLLRRLLIADSTPSWEGRKDPGSFTETAIPRPQRSYSKAARLVTVDSTRTSASASGEYMSWASWSWCFGLGSRLLGAALAYRSLPCWGLDRDSLGAS